ncbi:hypothetical protein OROHE_026964 [Orobanche hederae]
MEGLSIQKGEDLEFMDDGDREVEVRKNIEFSGGIFSLIRISEFRSRKIVWGFHDALNLVEVMTADIGSWRRQIKIVDSRLGCGSIVERLRVEFSRLVLS